MSSPRPHSRLLPPEILLQIGSTIDCLGTLRALTSANRAFHTLFEPLLYKRDIRDGLTTSSAIPWAAVHGSLDIIQKALHYGADIPLTFRVSRHRDGKQRLVYGLETRYYFNPDDAIGKANGSKRQPCPRAHPLCLAVQHGHGHIVEFLLDRRCDVDLRDPEGFSLLCLAVIHNHLDLVRLLLSRGAPQDGSYPGTGERQTYAHFVSQSLNRNSAVQIAAWMGNREIVELLLQHDKEKSGPDSLSNSRRRPSAAQLQDAVQCALRQGHKEDILALLIDAGANLNFSFRDPRTKSTCTPLLFAVAERDIRLVKLLLDSGNARANYLICADEDTAPLYQAVLQQDIATIKLLIGPSSRRNRTRALARSIDYPDTLIAQILLENGTPPDFIEADKPPPQPSFECDFPEPKVLGRPLIRAICAGRLELVKLLVEHGADLNEYDNSCDDLNRSALIYAGSLEIALELGYGEIADFLRGRGARDDIGKEAMERVFAGFAYKGASRR
ncbi:ankyrin repeat-containing domain protein [Aspergillus heterothallicus]